MSGPPNPEHDVLVLGEQVTVLLRNKIGIEWWEDPVVGRCAGWSSVGIVVVRDDREEPLLIPWTSIAFVEVDKNQHKAPDPPCPF